MTDHDQLQRLLRDYPPEGFPTVRDIADEKEPETFDPRTEAEDSCRSVMPGDSMQGHLFEATMEPNPFLGLPRSDLQEMLSWMEGQERRRVQDALRLQQLQHSDGKWPGRP